MKKQGLGISFFKLAAVISISWLSYTPNVFAGTRDGGGGIGVYCKTGISRLQILDLYEAREIKHLSPLTATGDFYEQVYQAWLRDLAVSKNPLENWRMPTRAQSDQAVDKFFKTAVVFTQEILPPTEDATLPVIPHGCDFVQIAVNKLNSDQTLKINFGYWNQLNTEQRAALIYHELFYSTRMSFAGDSTSDNVRAYIGELFSERQPIPKFYDMPSKNLYKCFAKNLPTKFYYYQSVNTQQNLISFDSINDTEVLPWRAVFNAGPFDILAHHQDFSVNGPVASDIDSGHYQFGIHRKNGGHLEINIKDLRSGQTWQDQVVCQYFQ